MAESVVTLRVDASGANRALQGVQNRTNALQKSFGGLKTAIVGSGLGLLARQAVRTSANFDKLNVRLGLLTKASGTFARSQEIAANAQKAFGLSATEALEGITDITARLQPLGVGVEDIKSTFFGFNTAAKLAGASTIEASNAFRQLAQALGSGRLAGDEFRSISEQIPTLLKPIADELDVDVGKLKELAAQGKLTSDVVLRALRKIETDGAASLKALVAADPTQVFKNLSNATEDLARAFGDKLNPVVMPAIESLTALTVAATNFVNSPIGQTAAIFAAIAIAAKGVTLLLPVLAAGLIKVAAAGGVLTIALNAIPFVAVATGIGAIVTQLIKQKEEQDKVTEAIKKGEKAQLEAMEADIGIKMAKEIATINESNDKRTIAAAERRLALLHEQMKPIKERLDQVIQENAEVEKGNKLIKKKAEETEKLKINAEKVKKVFEDLRDNINNDIKNGIKGLIKGTSTLGDLLNNVADRFLDVALNQALFGSALGSQGKKGGGILGAIGLFANGGRPPVGKASIVGERGPELFVPSTAGTIIPNNQLGGGSTNNIVVNVNMEGGVNAEGGEEEGRALGSLIAVAVQSEIIKQQRPGGLLTNTR